MKRDAGGPSTGQEVPKIEEYAIIPPDGRWGWLVVLAAFYCNVVIDGIIFTFGMYSSQMKETYKDDNVTEAHVALIGSLMFGFHLAAGPLCAGLTKSFGIRPVVVSGALITFLSLGAACFTPPFWALTIILGVIAGTSMCLIYMNSIMVTSMYFSRYRLLAVGIVVCGTGAGTVIFSESSNMMVNTISWQRAHLYLAICALLMAVAGLVFRPIKPIGIASMRSIPREEMKSILSVESVSDTESDRIVVLSERFSSINSVMDATSVALEAYAAELHQERRRDNLEQLFSFMCRCCCQTQTEIILMNPKTKKELISGQGQGSAVNATTFYIMPATRLQRVKKSFSDMEWTLLKIPSFVLFTLSGAFSCTAIIMLFFFQSDNATAGKGNGSANLVSSLGGANMAWRIFLGLISLIPRMNYRPVNVLCHMVGGAAIIGLGISTNTTLNYSLSAIIGAGLGSFAVFRPVLLLDIVGIGRIAYATGIWFMFTGILSIAGPPIGSYLNDVTNDSSCVYYISGSLFIISAIMMMFIRTTRNSYESSLDELRVANT